MLAIIYSHEFHEVRDMIFFDLIKLLDFSSSFQRYQQEDAHEFLQCFLERLESCQDSKLKECTDLKSDNFVRQVFGGSLVSKVCTLSLSLCVCVFHVLLLTPQFPALCTCMFMTMS